MRKDEGGQERMTRNGGRALMATPRGGKSETKTKARGAKMAERKGKKPPPPLSLRFISRGRALRSGCPACINCRESSPHADEWTPPRLPRPHHRGRAIIAAKTSGDRGKRSHPPATPPTTRAHAAATPEKTRPRCRAVASTARHLMTHSLAKQGGPSSGANPWLETTTALEGTST
jgi:hypothetical protein